MKHSTICGCILLLIPGLICAQGSAVSQDTSLQTHDISMEVYLDELVFKDKKTSDPALTTNSQNTDSFLHGLAGISMIRRGNFANEPMLRGMTTDRTIVTINGMRIFGACTDKMDPVSAYVEPINLGSLDVNFGGGNNMLGTTTGGSVNFELKKPVFNPDKAFTGTAGMQYGSVAQSLDELADLNFSKNRLAVRMSGVHRKASNYRDGTGEEVRYSQYEKYNYAASLSYRLKSGALNADFIGDDGYNIGYPALPMDVAYAKAKLMAVSYMAEHWYFVRQPELKVYHNYINHVMDDTKRDSVTMHMDMPGRTSTSGAYLSGAILLDDKPVNFKLDAYHTLMHAEMTMYEDEEDTVGMYMETWPDINRSVMGAEFNYVLGSPVLEFPVGGRLEVASSFLTSAFGKRQFSVFNKSADQRYFTTYSASAGIRKSWDHFSSLLKASVASRLPTATEQFGFYLFNRLDDFDYIGDPDLKTEKSLQLDWSAEWKYNALEWKVALFSYWFRDYIMGIYQPELSAMTIGARGVKTYSNTSKALMTGGEVSVSYRATDATRFYAHLNFVYGEDFEQDPLPQMPPLKVHLGLAQRVAGFSIVPTWEWSATQNRNSEKFYEVKTKTYHVLNVDITRSIKWNATSLEVNGGIKNAFDAAYRENMDISGILRPGRSLYAGIKFKF